MATVESVNVGAARPTIHSAVHATGIDKRPVTGSVEITVPGYAASGLVGDVICDVLHHGGPDQAIYAYAREDLDTWAAELGRELRSGTFGENLTTIGLDVNGAVIGERWRIGDDVVLEVSVPRIPCRTFAGWLAEQGWIKRFTARARPGAYLRVISTGRVEAGAPIMVIHRPDHGVTVATTFRALTTAPELLPRLLDAPELPAEVHEVAIRRSPRELDKDPI
jgi:MOSC domain-containing protein YiiM